MQPVAALPLLERSGLGGGRPEERRRYQLRETRQVRRLQGQAEGGDQNRHQTGFSEALEQLESVLGHSPGTGDGHPRSTSSSPVPRRGAEGEGLDKSYQRALDGLGSENERQKGGSGGEGGGSHEDTLPLRRDLFKARLALESNLQHRASEWFRFFILCGAFFFLLGIVSNTRETFEVHKELRNQFRLEAAEDVKSPSSFFDYVKTFGSTSRSFSPVSSDYVLDIYQRHYDASPRESPPAVAISPTLWPRVTRSFTISVFIRTPFSDFSIIKKTLAGTTDSTTFSSCWELTPAGFLYGAHLNRRLGVLNSGGSSVASTWSLSEWSDRTYQRVTDSSKNMWSVTDGNWHHYGIVHDRDTTTFFLDGEAIETVSNPTHVGSTGIDGAYSQMSDCFGGTVTLGDSDRSGLFFGLRWIPRALPAYEVVAMMASSLSLKDLVRGGYSLPVEATSEDETVHRIRDLLGSLAEGNGGASALLETPPEKVEAVVLNYRGGTVALTPPMVGQQRGNLVECASLSDGRGGKKFSESLQRNFAEDLDEVCLNGYDCSLSGSLSEGVPGDLRGHTNFACVDRESFNTSAHFSFLPIELQESMWYIVSAYMFDGVVQLPLPAEITTDSELVPLTQWIDLATTKLKLIQIFFSAETETMTIIDITYTVTSGGVQHDETVIKSFDRMTGRQRVIYNVTSAFVFCLCLLAGGWSFLRVYSAFAKILCRRKEKKGRQLKGFQQSVKSAFFDLSMYASIAAYTALLWTWRTRLERGFFDEKGRALIEIPWDDPSRWIENYWQMGRAADDILSDFDELVIFDYLGTFLAILALARLVLYTTAHPKIALLVDTVLTALDDLFHFFCIFSVVFMGFAYLGTLCFGHLNEDFSTIPDALWTQFRMLIGDWPWDAETYSQTETLSVIYLFFFAVVCFFILLNFFLAIIIDAYAEVKKVVEETSVAKNLFLDLLHNLTFSCLRWRYGLSARVRERVLNILLEEEASISEDSVCPIKNFLGLVRCAAYDKAREKIKTVSRSTIVKALKEDLGRKEQRRKRASLEGDQPSRTDRDRRGSRDKHVLQAEEGAEGGPLSDEEKLEQGGNRDRDLRDRERTGGGLDEGEDPSGRLFLAVNAFIGHYSRMDSLLIGKDDAEEAESRRTDEEKTQAREEREKRSEKRVKEALAEVQHLQKSQKAVAKALQIILLNQVAMLDELVPLDEAVEGAEGGGGGQTTRTRRASAAARGILPGLEGLSQVEGGPGCEDGGGGENVGAEGSPAPVEDHTPFTGRPLRPRGGLRSPQRTEGGHSIPTDRTPRSP